MEHLTSQLYFLGLHTSKPLVECAYQENKSDKQDIPWLYHERALHNYFIPCHGKYSGQHNQCDARAAHGRNVGWNSFKYKMAYLYSDWLYFLWHGIKLYIKHGGFNVTHAWLVS